MSTTGKSNPNKKVQQLLVDIQNGDAKKVIKALKGLESHGNISALEPLLNYWKTVTDAEIDRELAEFFAALKDTESRHEIMEVLLNDESEEFRIKLLTAVWNSKVDFSDYLAQFVTIAAEGGFMETLECLTIIENLDGPFEEEQFFESQIALKNYLDNRASSSDQKAQLMSEIALIIKDLESNHVDL
jgi:hypothetical protein